MRLKNLSLVVLVSGMIAGGCSSISFLTKSPADKFARIVDDYFSGAYSQQPKADSLHPFPWLSRNADLLDAETAGRVLMDLHSVDTTELSVDDRIDWLQLEAALKRTQRDVSLDMAARNPMQYLTVGGLTWRLSGTRTLSSREWDEILQTLRRAPVALGMGRRQLNGPPPLWINLAANTAGRYAGFLSGAFVAKVKNSAPDSMKNELLEAGNRASEAISQFGHFLSDSLPRGSEIGWRVGTEYYNWLLANVNFLPYTAASMIREGWRVHDETKAALTALARRIDSTKTWQQLVEEMKERHPQPGTIADAYRRESDRVKALLLDKRLVTIPEPETLLFVPTPPSLRETYAWGGYGGIVDRDSVATGRFFVTDVVPGMTDEAIRQKLRIQNYGWITVIALHEGYPGHHLQALYARKNPSKVRSRLGSTYYGEGWALYCENWMARSGFYQNADDSLAWLQMRLWRTARVIVDPSIHTGAMTYEEAVQFMVKEVGLERSAAEAEVNRYTTWPTQAPSYIIGWLEIERLEKEIKAKFGARFNERDFVERVLKVGSLPLELMKRAVWKTYHESMRGSQ